MGLRESHRKAMTRRIVGKVILYLGLILLSSVVLVPLYAVVMNSFKNLAESAIITLEPPSEWHFENYATVIKDGNIPRAMGNGLFITLVTVVSVVICSSLAAFIISRRKCRTTRFAYLYLLIGMMAPIAVIPEMKIMQALHLSGSMAAIIFIHITVNLPFSTFIFSGFINGVPNDLDESAILDGCGPIRLFFQVIAPLLKPVIFTVVIVTFMNSWNDFQYGLYFLTRPEMYTMPLTVYAFKGHYTQSLNLLCGDLVLTMIPIVIVYLLAQKYIVSGMTAGAVKG